MWVLLFIIFSQPYHVQQIDVLGTFASREECNVKVNEVMNFQPDRTTLSCIPINAKNIRKKIRST